MVIIETHQNTGQKVVNITNKIYWNGTVFSLYSSLAVSDNGFIYDKTITLTQDV